MDAANQKLKSLTLRAIPKDVYQELVRVQGQEKLRRYTSFNLEQTVYKIIKSTIKKEGYLSVEQQEQVIIDNMNKASKQMNK